VPLHVSNGHPLGGSATATPTTATTTETATTTAAGTQAAVPDVTGEDMATASGDVEAAGFVAETDPAPGSGTPGSVTAEDPSASAEAPQGSIVRLSVVTGSSRPSAGVPNVVGQKAAAARSALLNANLTVKTVYKQGPARRIGVVLAESPTGSEPRYTQITLTVGS
jgi:eukaryotic-like serine/threonine-protein kinase